MYFRRYSSPPLNERLIPLPVCPFLRFFPLASSGDRLPAYPLARTVTPSHQHLCFPLYRPVTSRLSLRGVPILPPAVCRTFLSFPASIFSLLLSRPLSPTVHEEKNGEKRPPEMESLTAAHLSTRLIPLFSQESSVAPHSESPTAHGTWSECGRIKLEVQRMIGQSFTRLHPFFPLSMLVGTLAKIPAADIGMTNIMARWCISNVAHSFPEV